MSAIAHPHQPDIQVLLRTCAYPLNRVNLIFNSKMAEAWASRYLPREIRESMPDPIGA